MSTEPFIGEVKLLAFQFAPKSYQLCAGQILAIASNTALFSLLGTTYGGNGSTTFALPDLQGRMPIGQGTGPGLPSHSIDRKSTRLNSSHSSISCAVFCFKKKKRSQKTKRPAWFNNKFICPYTLFCNL